MPYFTTEIIEDLFVFYYLPRFFPGLPIGGGPIFKPPAYTKLYLTYPRTPDPKHPMYHFWSFFRSHAGANVPNVTHYRYSKKALSLFYAPVSRHT